jgi:hypothetical protein
MGIVLPEVGIGNSEIITVCRANLIEIGKWTTQRMFDQGQTSERTAGALKKEDVTRLYAPKGWTAVACKATLDPFATGQQATQVRFTDNGEMEVI